MVRQPCCALFQGSQLPAKERSGCMVYRPAGLTVFFPPHQRNIAFVFQEPRLWPHMTVRQNVMFGLSMLKPADRSERLAHIADNTGIKDILTRYPTEPLGRSGAARRACPGHSPEAAADSYGRTLDESRRRRTPGFSQCHPAILGRREICPVVCDARCFGGDHLCQADNSTRQRPPDKRSSTGTGRFTSGLSQFVTATPAELCCE